MRRLTVFHILLVVVIVGVLSQSPTKAQTPDSFVFDGVEFTGYRITKYFNGQPFDFIVSDTTACINIKWEIAHLYGGAQMEPFSFAFVDFVTGELVSGVFTIQVPASPNSTVKTFEIHARPIYSVSLPGLINGAHWQTFHWMGPTKEFLEISYSLCDAGQIDSGPPANGFNPGDGRQNPGGGDNIAVYCNNPVEGQLNVYGINESVGFPLTTFTYAEITVGGEAGVTHHLGGNGDITVNVAADGSSWLSWTGGPLGASGQGNFAKAFNCGIPVLPEGVVEIPINYFGQPYNFQVDSETCAIVNGAEIVAQEINRFRTWAENLPQQLGIEMYLYLKNDGYIDTFRSVVEASVARGAGCPHTYYQIGEHTMDVYGLGNVMYGYYTEWAPNLAVHAFADLEQLKEDHRLDFPDDARQIDWGRAIASSYSGINPVAILSLIPSDFVDSK